MMKMLFTFLFMLACSGMDDATTKKETNQEKATQGENNNVTSKKESSQNKSSLHKQNEKQAFAPDSDRTKAKLGVSKPTSRVSGSLLERHKKIGNTPEDAIALWIEATIRAQRNEPQGWEGIAGMTLNMAAGKPLQYDLHWRKHVNNYFIKKLRSKDPCFRSLVVGANPDNNYQIDLNNIRVQITANRGKNADGNKYMIRSSGAMDRPFYLKQSNKTGLLYITNYSTLFVDVRPANNPNKERFR